MRGSISSARAMAMRWRCPPEQRDAALAHLGVIAVGELEIKSCARAALAAATISSSRRVLPAVGDVLADGRRKEQALLQDDADLRAQALQRRRP